MNGFAWKNAHCDLFLEVNWQQPQALLSMKMGFISSSCFSITLPQRNTRKQFPFAVKQVENLFQRILLFARSPLREYINPWKFLMLNEKFSSSFRNTISTRMKFKSKHKIFTCFWRCLLYLILRVTGCNKLSGAINRQTTFYWKTCVRNVWE